MSLWESFKKGVSRNLDVLTHTVQTGHTPHGKNYGGMGGYNQPNITVKGDNNVITMSGKGGVDVKKQQPAKEAVQQEKPSLLRKFSDKTFHALGLGNKKEQPVVSQEIVKKYEKMSGKKVDIKELTAKINAQEQQKAVEQASKSFVEKSATLNWAAEKMVAWVDKKLAIETPNDYVAHKVGVSKEEAVKLTEGMNKQQLDKNPPLFVETHQKAIDMKTHEFKLEYLPKEQYKQVQSLINYAGGEKTIDKLKTGDFVADVKKGAVEKAMDIVKPNVEAWKADPKGWTKSNADNLLENTVGSKGKEAIALHTPDAKEAMKPENMQALEKQFQANPGKFIEAGHKHVAENKATHGIEMKQAARLSDRENSIRDFFTASEQAKTQTPEKAPSLEAKNKEPEKSKGPEL